MRRFIAGDTVDEAIQVAEELVAKGLLVTMDLLGESVADEAEAIRAKAAFKSMLEKIAASPCAASTNISIKLTQCGLDQSDTFAESNLREVLTKASEFNNFVRVDMEASDYTERTIRMLERVWADFKNTGTVLQSYLLRTPEDVNLMVRLRMRTRLVKGAYLEPPSVAIQDKAEVDAAYIAQAKTLLESGFYPAIATHDEAIIKTLKEYVAEKGIGKDKFEWQMLFGIRRDLQDSLRAEGFNVRVYVPFGESWYPYFSRRLAERPANLFFMLKSLFKG